MTYPDDFTDAHRRHWEDAELLFASDRWPNADQLYGFSAESGLKTMMKALGVKRIPREHIQYLWPEFAKLVTQAQGRKGGRYINFLPRQGKPFANWSHHDRYAHRRNFPKQVAEQHRRAARSVRRMVQQADQDGLL